MRSLGSIIARPLMPLLIVGAAAFAVPSTAFAQNPLGSCRPDSFFFSHNGPASGDVTGKGPGSVSGEVRILCNGTWIFAELVEWDEHTVKASGELLVTQEGLRVNADHMEMDRQTKLGIFYDAFGTAKLTEPEKWQPMFGEMEPQVMFEGEKLERIGPNSYRLTNGRFTTCLQPTPRWEMTSSTATIVLNDHASLKNAALKVKGVPLLYLPYMWYPLKKEDRATGFLIPVYTSSGVSGQGISNAFYWAIDRSQDATFNYDYFSKTGQGGGSEYRYKLAPGSDGWADFYLMNENERLAADGSVERTAHRWSRVRGGITQRLPHGFRLNGSANYYTDITAQQLYQQNILEQSRRDRNLTLGLTGRLGPVSMIVTADQRDYFNGSTISRRGTLPNVSLWGLGRGVTKSGPLKQLYVRVAGTAAYLEKKDDLANPLLDRSLWRFDSMATFSAPLASRGEWLRISGAGYWRLTNWMESLDPVTNTPVSVPLTRNLLNLRGDVVGPVLQRTFHTPDLKYAAVFRHAIEPRVSVDWLSPFNQLNQVIQIDPNIDRLVGGNTSINYSLTNRVIAKTHAGEQRDLLILSAGQTWYSNAQAGAVDPNYPVQAINSWSPFVIAAASQPTQKFTGRFQMFIDPVAKAVQTYSAMGLMQPDNEHFEIGLGWSKRQYIPSVPAFSNPNAASHFLNGVARFRFVGGKYGGQYSFNYDIRNGGFLQQGVQGFYNSQCCGVAMSYQMMNISQYGLSGVQRDRRIAVTFNLAGIGSFATPLGAFGR